MKNLFSSMLAALLLFVCLFGIGVPGAFATDLTYTTLPQDSDSELVLNHKSATAEASNKYSNIVLAAPTTTVVKSGSGILVAIVINTGAATATATVYDNTAASGTKIATIDAATTGTNFRFNCRFGTGLTIVTATAAANITCIYR